MHSNSWNAIINHKYQKGRTVEVWYRSGAIRINQRSAIWLSFRTIEQYFLCNLKWRVFSGSKILVGLDPIADVKDPLKFPDPLLFYLHRSGCFTWNRIIEKWNGLFLILKNAAELGIPQVLSSLWLSKKLSIEQMALKCASLEDHMVWSIPSSTTTVKDIYLDLIYKKIPPSRKIFPLKWWKLSCPLKVIIFSWLVFYNKNVTWENLRKRDWNGPMQVG